MTAICTRLSADERCLDWTSGRPVQRGSAWQYEGLADVGEGNTRPWYCAPEPLNRFIHRLPAETERLMMHGDDKLSASLIGHVHGLLGCAVTGNPGVVGADRHHHHIDRLPANALDPISWTLPKGGYDVDHGGQETETDSAQFHG